jgi:hypothetical protein
MKSGEKNRLKYHKLFITIFFIAFTTLVFAQPNLPPRNITVVATQSLHFGTFGLTGTSGGTVTVATNGARSNTGEIFLSNMGQPAQPAIFEIKLCQGRMVSVIYPPPTILNGSNGGTLTVNFGPSTEGNLPNLLVGNNCNFITTLRVGGILSVPGNAIPGIYSGYFEITFNQQ